MHVAESTTLTVKEAGQKWLQTGTDAGLERSTLDQYRQHIHFHIAPFIGSPNLSRVNVPTVRQFQDRVRAEGRSLAMVKRVTVSLGRASSPTRRIAVTWCATRCMKCRAAGRRGRPSERHQKARLRYAVDIPAHDEVRRIIEHATRRYRPFLITTIFTGPRASELRGPRWDDAELDKVQIHVRQRAAALYLATERLF